MHPSTFKPIHLRRRRFPGVPPYALVSLCAVVLSLLLIAGLFFLIGAPEDFPIGERIEIPPGTSLVESTRLLAEHDVVRSAFLLQLLLIGQAGDPVVRAGTYQFPGPLSIFAVAEAVANGEYGVPLIRLTIPEGLDNEQIDALVADTLPEVSAGEFLEAADGKEGYLFPDTYHVPESFTAVELVSLMEATFRTELAVLRPQLRRSLYTEAEIVTMASILEREANSEETMRLISGILWKRIEHDMPLQVDASFAYLLGKSSDEITLEDLQLDSPYNTYRYRGLPPAPIGNPGLDALRAALDPQASSYLFYLTAPDGTFHYADTYEVHLENKRQYLN